MLTVHYFALLGIHNQQVRLGKPHVQIPTINHLRNEQIY